ncbi:energy transducer TonB [Pontibacter fetidus]|uniref:TonB C-terminal domain-containing protein n=1 Tax=Pontibacter fetidus TaxID=2700082 RepID=A0A6B2H0U5_9BACT|nr:energy transducer TonB [Pontibacter fetidus]NDK55941.1 hypothetical protein [Pontibacter fetidus]
MKVFNNILLAGAILCCTACISTKRDVIAKEQPGEPGKTEPLVAVKIYSPDEPNAPIPDEAPSIPLPSVAQQRAEAMTDTTIFTRLETEPTFNYKGKNATTYISEEIARIKEAYTITQKGIVNLKLVVERDGSLTNPVVLQTNSEILTKSSLAILSHMPYWRAGSLNGFPRRAYVTLEFNW